MAENKGRSQGRPFHFAMKLERLDEFGEPFPLSQVLAS